MVFILMLVNWSVEAAKWRLLVNRYVKISFPKALQSVIAGVTVSIFTPNRTGEFIGRAFILRGKHPVKAVLLTFVGSISQLLVTIIMGGISLSFIAYKILPVETKVNSLVYNILIILLLVFFGFLILAYFRMPVLTRIFREKIKVRFPRLFDYLRLVGGISRIELFQVMVFSLLRYFVFSLQFYLILVVFGIYLPVFDTLMIISLIFLALAVIPTIALSELGVRGSVSIYLLGAYLQNTTGFTLDEKQSLAVMLAAGTLWIINLALPAVSGIPFVFKLHFFRK
jgi:hypothetical protein